MSKLPTNEKASHSNIERVMNEINNITKLGK